MLTSHSDHLQIDWETGRSSRYHWVWLRQACECADCFNAHCRQRRFDPAAIAPGIRPERVLLDAHGVRIVWQDAHVSTYALERLARDDYREAIPPPRRQAGRRGPSAARRRRAISRSATCWTATPRCGAR